MDLARYNAAAIDISSLIGYTVEAIIVILLIWIASKYQEKAYEEKKETSQTFQTTNKAAGIFIYIRIAAEIVMAILFFIGGIYGTFTNARLGEVRFVGPLAILISLLLIYLLLVDIALARAKAKGRFY